MSQVGEDGAMKDHLPLYTSVGIEERRGMSRSLKSEIGGSREGRWRLTFYRKEHTVIERKYVAPSILLDELATDGLEPPASAGIVNANIVSANEWNAGPRGPFVHGGHITGKDHFGGR